MSSHNGGFSSETDATITLAKEVIREVDTRDDCIEEALVSFEDSLENGEDVLKCAQNLIISVSMADEIYSSNIDRISCKYLDSLGKYSRNGKLIWTIERSHGLREE